MTTNDYQTMDFGFVGSPSQSPPHSMFSTTAYFESTSESSNPDSPQNICQMMFTSGPMQYEMFNYGATPADFHPAGQHNKIPVEYTGSSTLDARDRRSRRSGSTSTSNNGEKDNLTNMHLRRRAQNRASQRAFRERKEKYVKGAEHQLEDLHEKHQDLLQSFNRQFGEVSRLNSRIAQLKTELNSMRNRDQPSFSDLMLQQPGKFDKFDAFSSHSDMSYNGPDCYFDKDAVDLNSEFALNSFQDSL